MTEHRTVKTIPMNRIPADPWIVRQIILNVTTKNVFSKATYVMAKMIAETDPTSLRNTDAELRKLLVPQENGNVQIWTVVYVWTQRKSVMIN